MYAACTTGIRGFAECRPLCRVPFVGHRAVELCVEDSHRADSFICRISKPPRAGEVLPKFSVARLLLGMEDREWMYTGRRGKNDVTPVEDHN